VVRSEAAGLIYFIAVNVCHNMPKLAGILAFVGLFLSVACSAHGGQVYKAVLSQPLKTKCSKAGDRVLLTTVPLKGLAESPIGQLDASIAEVQPSGKGNGSVLKINVNRSVPGNGSEHLDEARVVAVIAQSMVKEWWVWPGGIADRFSHIPDDDRREPGEVKLSESQLTRPSFCTTANERVYITAQGCETLPGGGYGLPAAGAGGR
jgi:hypothetical protein